MTPGYAFSRKDATQDGIVAALIAVGALVRELHRVGQGIPDLLVQFRGRIYLIECKSPDGTLERSQRDMIREGWIVHVVETPEQAIEVLTSNGAKHRAAA
jgi:hypothetical protein